MLLGAESVILCNNKALESISFGGTLLRRWEVESNIRYLKIIGGPPGRESFLVAVDDGRIYKMFLHKTQPMLLVSVWTFFLLVIVLAFT